LFAPPHALVALATSLEITASGRLLIAKLLLTPLIIGGLTLATRRWGHDLGGWLAGLPLTSGPVSIFLAAEQGPHFAQHAAVGAIAGVAALGLFSLAYALLAPRVSALPCVAAALGIFVLATVGTAVLPKVGESLPAAVVFATVTLVLVSRRMPRAGIVPRVSTPAWDIPARMAITTLVVVAITAGADKLGSEASGLLSPLPVFPAVIAAFTHREIGPGAAQRVLGGVVLGAFSIILFFIVVAIALPNLGAALTYAAAGVAALIANLGLRRAGRRFRELDMTQRAER
jgi:hypothetical protein